MSGKPFLSEIFAAAQVSFLRKICRETAGGFPPQKSARFIYLTAVVSGIRLQ
jgi:hypothetical protein